MATRCGSKMGVALQIRADLKEFWQEGDEQHPSHEVMNKKKLLPVVYALEKSDVGGKRRLGEVYFKRVLEPNDVVNVRNLLEELGVKDDCENMAEQYRLEAISKLDITDMSQEGKSSLTEYIDFSLR